LTVVVVTIPSICVSVVCNIIVFQVAHKPVQYRIVVNCPQWTHLLLWN